MRPTRSPARVAARPWKRPKKRCRSHFHRRSLRSLIMGGLVLIFGALLLITGRAFPATSWASSASRMNRTAAPGGVYSFYTSLTLAPFVFLLTIPAIIAFCRARYQSRRAWIVAGVTLLVCAGFAVLPRIEPFVAALTGACRQMAPFRDGRRAGGVYIARSGATGLRPGPALLDPSAPA